MVTNKSYKILMLLIVASLLLVACGGTNNNADNNAAQNSNAADNTSEDNANNNDNAEENNADDDVADDGTCPAPSGEPIVVGGSLALTGFLSSTAAIHELVGNIFVEQLNAGCGLLGRPVEWRLLNDESSADLAASHYERLITEDEVDLLIGPYGTGGITAGMAVAERYGYVFPHHTASLTYAYTYEWHFPLWYTGLDTHLTTPDLVFDALDSTGTPPQTIAFVVNQFPGSMFLARGRDGVGGAVNVAVEHGYDVVLDVDFPLGTSDLSAIAAQVRDADPDFVYLAGLGLDANNLISAMTALNYKPAGLFIQWPAPGPLANETGEGTFSVALFEAHEPFLSFPGAAELYAQYTTAAEEAGFQYTVLETQGAISWATWQVLIAGVEGAGSLDQAEIANYLLSNEMETIIGTVVFNADNQNYGPDLQKVKQVQDGDWVVVFPPEFANEGSDVDYQP